MSVQKLIAEAEKLLDKGKYPEAIEKLKSAFNTEPTNQLVATKLANVFVANGDSEKAAKVYVVLANRLSEAGKAQVAIAIYKQALELNPSDIELKFRFAKECEGIGKLGDALIYGQQVLQYFVQRKKYFDANNVMPMLVRTHTRDESYKLAWIEVMQFSQAEQKLLHLIVALCGPPGLTSQEFPTGGEPTAMSETLYESLKRLAEWFPRDAKIAYAVAWSAYRREKMADFFHYAHECFRRDPDFSLCTLLFTRWLAESTKLNEAIFVFKYLKERITADKSVDMLSLNRQVEAFVEKNGWVNFATDSGDELNARSFCEALLGRPPVNETGQQTTEESTENSEEKNRKKKISADDQPAEIEISLNSSSSTDQGELEIQLTGGQTRVIGAQNENIAKSENTNKNNQIEAPEQKAAPTKNQAQAAVEKAPVDSDDSVEFTSIIKTTPQDLGLKSPEKKEISSDDKIEASHEKAKGGEAAASAQGVQEKTTVLPQKPLASNDDDSVEFTSIIKREDINTSAERDIQNDLKDAFSTKNLEEQAEVVANEVNPPVGAVNEPDASELDSSKASSKQQKFNPLKDIVQPPSPEPELEEKTQMFSPMEVLDAANSHRAKIPDPDTKTKIPEPKIAEKKIELEAKDQNLYVEGEKTQMFQPAEAVDAGIASRRPIEAKLNVNAAKWKEMAPPPAPPPDTRQIEVKKSNLEQESKTEVFSKPAEISGTQVIPATQVLATPKSSGAELMPPPLEVNIEKIPSMAIPIAPPNAPASLPNEAAKIEIAPIYSPPLQEPAKLAESTAHEPQAPHSQDPEVDLGDDLLQDPTKRLTKPTLISSTAQMIKDLKDEIQKQGQTNADAKLLMRKADRYIAKRNYYLARKILRHAKAFGADEEAIKEKLRDIRKQEMPDSLYNSVSTDHIQAENSELILERLESEFNLSDDDLSADIAAINARLDAILEQSDVQTALDFAIGLHEMGLFQNAENLLLRLVDRDPDSAFDAYYLVAISKMARKDYAGAASILKNLGADSAKSEREKISVYYALGEIFERMQQSERSKNYYKLVAEIDSNYRNIREKLEE